MDIDRQRRTTNKKTGWSGDKPDKFSRSHAKASKHKSKVFTEDQDQEYDYDVRSVLDLT